MKLRERAMVALKQAEDRRLERTKQIIPKALKKYLGVGIDEIENWGEGDDCVYAVVDGLQFTAVKGVAGFPWEFWAEVDLYLLWYCGNCGKYRERASVYSLSQLGDILSTPTCYSCCKE